MQIPSPPVVLALALHPRGSEVGAERIGLGGWGAAVDRLTISVGMIPRGEAGLTFANSPVAAAAFNPVPRNRLLSVMIRPPAVRILATSQIPWCSR